MKKIWLLVVSLLIFGILPALIYLVGQRQELRNKAAPATTLAVTPASLAKKMGDTFTMEVTIDTGENQVVAAELHLTYDPTKLEAQSINNGTLFSNILASGTVEAGAASITVGASNAKEPVKGTGTVAVIRFTALAKTDSPTAVKLASNTFVGGLGEGAVNVLVSTTPATVTITQDPAQSTPTPTPIATISAQTPPPATPSATLVIVSPTSEGAPTVDKPVIRGKAAPGTTVTITIYSTPQTATVTADSSGNWSYTPDTPLESGPHNVVASVTDQNGQTQTATTAFVVASSEKAIGGATESAIPVSGTVETTLLLLLLGSACIVFGLFFPHWSHGTHETHGDH
ncbi:hypothetical protein HY339_01235 [Candidatus Gottesmanbacteria bacterium]|nr:hypothetical protein [Candidatus Gottesmanbacteria bacterium]